MIKEIDKLRKLIAENKMDLALWGKSIFCFKLKPKMYFTINSSTKNNTKQAYRKYDKQNIANMEGAPIFLKGFGEGENMDWGESDFGQWRLIPTGEQVKE